MADDGYAGPLNFAVFVLPEGADLEEIAREIQFLSATHTAEVLDIERIVLGPDGRAARAELTGAASVLSGAETGLLPEESIEIVGEQIGAGEEAMVVIYEDRTLARLSALCVREGGREGLVGSIDPAELVETIGAAQ